MFVDTWKVLTSYLWVLQAVKGFRIPPLCLTQPRCTGNSTSTSSRGGSSDKRRAQAATGEGSGDSGTRQPGWLLFKPLLSAQEEWPNETSDQPETVE